jgi:hypothetical protein
MYYTHSSKQFAALIKRKAKIFYFKTNEIKLSKRSNKHKKIGSCGETIIIAVEISQNISILQSTSND